MEILLTMCFSYLFQLVAICCYILDHSFVEWSFYFVKRGHIVKESKTFGETLGDLTQALDRFKIGFGMMLRLDKFMNWLVKIININ